MHAVCNRLRALQCTIQEVGGETMMGRSIRGVAVVDGSLYSRFYGICGVIVITIQEVS